MSKLLREQVFTLSGGVNLYGPEISVENIEFVTLNNVAPRGFRLVPFLGYSFVQNLDESPVNTLAYTLSPDSTQALIYAFTETSIFLFDVGTALFPTTPHVSGLTASGDSYACVRWYDKLYITRLGVDLSYLDGNGRQEFNSEWQENAGNIQARYAISDNGHLLVANLREGSSRYATRLRWSDLHDPENFVVSTSTEADFYDFEASDVEITGLSKNRGRIIIFTRTSIWIGAYHPLPTGYRFEPLYTEVGNLYHYSVVSHPERDYFIAEDNFYALEGSTLRPIGDPIMNFWRSTFHVSADQRVTGFWNKLTEEVTWTYKNAEGNPIQITYNTREDSWSHGDYLPLTAALFSVPFAVSQAPIAHWDMSYGTLDSEFWEGKTIDGPWQITQSKAPAILGMHTGDLLFRVESNVPVVLDSPVPCTVETKDYFSGDLTTVQEFDEVTVLYKREGNPNLFLEVGTRMNTRDPLVWTEKLSLHSQRPEQATFKFRNHVNAAFVRFRLTWENSLSDYITELSGISFKVLLKDAGEQ